MKEDHLCKYHVYLLHLKHADARTRPNTNEQTQQQCPAAAAAMAAPQHNGVDERNCEKRKNNGNNGIKANVECYSAVSMGYIYQTIYGIWPHTTTALPLFRSYNIHSGTRKLMLS